MNIYQIVNALEEEVGDTAEDIDQAIIDEFSPPQEQESDNEGVKILPRVLPSEALQLLQRLRLHEEQAEDCNTSFIDWLDRHERTVNARRFRGLQQRQLSDYFTNQ